MRVRLDKLPISSFAATKSLHLVSKFCLLLFFCFVHGQEQFTLARENEFPLFHHHILADLNNDGLVDIVGISGEHEIPTALIGDSNGGFTVRELTIQHQAYDITVGDVDNDGDEDIVFAANSDLILLRNQGNASFEPEYVWQGTTDPNSLQSDRFTLADLNADGSADLFRFYFGVSPYVVGRFVYYPNDGSGGFGAESLVFSSSNSNSLFLDVDCDSELEILRFNHILGDLIYLDNIEAGFVDIVFNVIANNFSSIALVGELEKDGCNDFYAYMSIQRRIALFTRVADETFETKTFQLQGTNLQTFTHMDAADVNGDGNIDFLANGDSTTGIFMGNDKNELNPYQEISDKYDSCHSYFIDSDGDGDLDILSVCIDESDKTYLSWHENMAGLAHPDFDYEDCQHQFVNNSAAYYPESVVSWDFGNGAYSSEISPKSHYDTPGTYLATLTICNDNGCNSLTESVTVEHVTDFHFPSVAQVGEPLKFEDYSEGYTNWTWVIGPDYVSTNSFTEYTFYNPGTYNVELWVTDAEEVNCTSHFKEKVTILDLESEVPVFIYPNPSFGTTEILLPAGETWNLVITDFSGNKLEVGTLVGPRARIETRMLAAGVYICQFSNEIGKTITRKLVAVN